MNLLEQLKEDEGFSKKIYLCPAKKRTIGYGYNVDSNMLKLNAETLAVYGRVGITEQQAESVLKMCIDEIRKTLLVKIERFNLLDSVRQNVLINMCFNMGYAKLAEFKNFLAAISERDFETAAAEMEDSKWFHQVGLRSKRLVNEMRLGVIA